MPSWPSASRVCSGRFFARVLFVSAIAAAVLPAQQTPASKSAAWRRANELSLAGRRPGRDKLGRAATLYNSVDAKSSTNDSQTTWKDPCRKQILAVDFDAERRIQVIRAGVVPLTSDGVLLPPSPWNTGLGLRVDDPTAKVVQLYGPPDSKSPSTRGGQPLELWYYAFDWAGPDVPRVMEVLCTREQDGKPGRVVEIALAAPGL